MSPAWKTGVFDAAALSDEYQQLHCLYSGNEQNEAYVKISSDRRTLYWYNKTHAGAQLNNAGWIYHYFAVSAPTE